jgi:transcriptional regulator with XRE-family HTH domain
MKTIGSTLKEAREINALTLRQIEEGTGISNAYLSQLENDKIKNPSALVLFKLASIYNVDLNTLLSETGIINKKTTTEITIDQEWTKRFAFSAGNLTENQKTQVMDYIQFLKSKDV